MNSLKKKIYIYFFKGRIFLKLLKTRVGLSLLWIKLIKGKNPILLQLLRHAQGTPTGFWNYFSGVFKEFWRVLDFPTFFDIFWIFGIYLVVRPKVLSIQNYICYLSCETLLPLVCILSVQDHRGWTKCLKLIDPLQMTLKSILTIYGDKITLVSNLDPNQLSEIQ